ncbi:MAG: iron-sulfur cluster assembly accessory protein [Myxococcales bacterium]|nr:iron-sulfur cluster assembly accessory protein [Myxococcales bacterium]MCB9671743.1 iron-sulfur cluster assembly accessory protein [Alphaproteobacteria bacterium]
MITITEAAARRINEVVTERGVAGLRFGLTDGGCSGYSYMLDFEREADEDDMVFEQDGARVYVHPMHLPFLQGSVIRFLDGDFQTGFQIDNPNAKRVCGCGESFDVD